MNNRIMNKIAVSLFAILLSTIDFIAQTPQNVNPGKGKGKSVWDDTTTIILIVAFILLLIVSRSWSKRIGNKRDEISRRNKEKEEEKK